MHRVIPRTVWTDLSSESENSSLHELKSEKLLAPAPALCLPWPRRTSLRTRRARDLSAAGNGQAPRVRGSCVKTEGPSRSGPEAARGRRVEGKGAAGRLTECGSAMGAPRPSLTPPRKRPPPAPRAPRRSGPLEPASTGRPSPPPCAAAAALPRRRRAAPPAGGSNNSKLEPRALAKHSANAPRRANPLKF